MKVTVNYGLGLRLELGLRRGDFNFSLCSSHVLSISQFEDIHV